MTGEDEGQTDQVPQGGEEATETPTGVEEALAELVADGFLEERGDHIVPTDKAGVFVAFLMNNLTLVEMALLANGHGVQGSPRPVLCPDPRLNPEL